MQHDPDQDSVEVINLINRSCAMGCFDALMLLSKINFDKLFAGKIEFPNEILIPIFNAIQWQGTPALLLCAANYFNLGRYYHDKLQDKDESITAMQNSLTFLHLADELENQSTDEIYNNYYGQGIKKGNYWNIPTIAQLKAQLISYSGLNSESQADALIAANRLAQQYQSFFPKEGHIKSCQI